LTRGHFIRVTVIFDNVVLVHRNECDFGVRKKAKRYRMNKGDTSTSGWLSKTFRL
jgi:hypothetical protein